MNTKTKYFNIIRNTLISIFFAVTCGILIMIGLYSINTDKIQKNVESSLNIYKKEHLYFYLVPKIQSSMLDNLTESIMLNIAAFHRGKNFNGIKDNALLNPRYEFEDLSSYDSLIKIYSPNETENDNYEIKYYPRYWHGYLLYLKPLLLFFNLSDIRIINIAVQFLLLILVTLELYKKDGKKLILPYYCAVYVVNPLSAAFCLNFCNMYYITLISSLIMLKKEIYKSPDFYYFFLWLGILTPFFDILTYPLVGIGVNLIIFTALSDNKSPIKQTLTSLLFWFTGYISMWSAEWITATFLTNQNVLNDAFSNIMHRINGVEDFLESYTVIDVIKNNINALINNPFRILIACILICCIYMLVSKKYFFKFEINKTSALLLIASLPLIWFIIIQNHSIVHSWFVHKNLAITVMAIVYILISSFHKNCEN